MFGSLRRWVASKAFVRGSALLRQERWRSAAFLLGRAAKMAPDHWEAHNNLAVALLKLARWEDAAGVARHAIGLDPAAADSHALLGLAMLQLQRWEEAAAAYRLAITVDPERYDSYDRLGMALWRLGRWDQVVDTYEAALKLRPGSHAAYNRLGIALMELARFDAATAAFRRAIELVAGDPAAAAELPGMQMGLANAMAQLDSASGAETGLLQQLLQRAAALHSGAVEHLNRGVELLTLEQWDDALSELAEASALTPDLGGVHFLQVDPLVRLGRLPDAVAAHRQAVAAGGPIPPLPGQPAAVRFERRRATFWTSDNLDANVFAAEQWLHELSAVPERASPGPRLLFVLDNDFGELATVKFFVMGQELAGRSTLLLPERLYAHNVDAVPGRTHPYGSVRDILEVVDREQPDIVFLCAGYMLWEHLDFPLAEVAHLLDQLRQRGCRVVTADPHVGMLSKRDPRTLISFEVPMEHAMKVVAQKYGAAVAEDPATVEKVANSRRAAEEHVWASLTASERIFRNTYHLYPSYCDVAGDDRAPTDARNIAFFNDRLVRPSTPVAGGTPHWLFILASTDCDIQTFFEGETGFTDIVASKLVETLAAGRHPVLIGPRAFIDKLIERMPTAEGIDILSQCPFTQFYSLLLSAEHAFYWNVVSHSLLIRLYNRLPIVLFDRGHLLRTAPAVRDRIVAWYYQGWEPTLRDHRTPLSLGTVEGWAAEYRREAARLVDRFRRAPSPDHMIADLMGRALTPGV
jgi:tetratricopeptide (TPR) repeat protein